jgi:hypothetical protein
MNYEMVKSGIVVLTKREEIDMTTADVAMGWTDAGCCLSAGDQEGKRKLI